MFKAIWNMIADYPPQRFVASLIWKLSESTGIGLGRLAPFVFGIMINRKSLKIK